MRLLPPGAGPPKDRDAPSTEAFDQLLTEQSTAFSHAVLKAGDAAFFKALCFASFTSDCMWPLWLSGMMYSCAVYFEVPMWFILALWGIFVVDSFVAPVVAPWIVRCRARRTLERMHLMGDDAYYRCLIALPGWNANPVAPTAAFPAAHLLLKGQSCTLHRSVLRTYNSRLYNFYVELVIFGLVGGTQFLFRAIFNALYVYHDDQRLQHMTSDGYASGIILTWVAIAAYRIHSRHTAAFMLADVIREKGTEDAALELSTLRGYVPIVTSTSIINPDECEII